MDVLPFIYRMAELETRKKRLMALKVGEFLLSNDNDNATFNTYEISMDISRAPERVK